MFAATLYMLKEQVLLGHAMQVVGLSLQRTQWLDATTKAE
jgi:hypothetical protein